MRERVGAERFDEIDRERKRARLSLPERNMLGTNAERDLSPGLFGRGVHRKAYAVELDAASVRGEPRRQHVHGRRADEAGDERRRRLLVDLDRRCRSARRGRQFMTISRSPSVIASTWSWVT